MPGYTDSLDGTYWIRTDRLGTPARVHKGTCQRVTTGLQVTAYPSNPRTPRLFNWVGPYYDLDEAAADASKLSYGKEVDGCVECESGEDLRRLSSRKEEVSVKTDPARGVKTVIFVVLFLLAFLAIVGYANPAIRNKIFPDREWEAKVECAQRWTPECERFR